VCVCMFPRVCVCVCVRVCVCMRVYSTHTHTTLRKADAHSSVVPRQALQPLKRRCWHRAAARPPQEKCIKENGNWNKCHKKKVHRPGWMPQRARGVGPGGTQTSGPRWPPPPPAVRVGVGFGCVGGCL